MRVVVQRARGASVSVDGEVVGGFDGPGLVALVGVTHGDGPDSAMRLAAKVHDLRIFDRAALRDADIDLAEEGSREVSAADAGLPVLVVSQFTLYGDTQKGRRPTWDQAAPGPLAEPIVEEFAAALRARGAHVSTGIFGADMEVALVNDGPMTLILEG